MSENKGPKMINDDYHPSFYLKNMRKDSALAGGGSTRKITSLPVTGMAFQLYNYAAKSIYADLDYTGVYKFLKKINNLE